MKNIVLFIAALAVSIACWAQKQERVRLNGEEINLTQELAHFNAYRRATGGRELPMEPARDELLHRRWWYQMAVKQGDDRRPEVTQEIKSLEIKFRDSDVFEQARMECVNKAFLAHSEFAPKPEELDARYEAVRKEFETDPPFMVKYEFAAAISFVPNAQKELRDAIARGVSLRQISQDRINWEQGIHSGKIDQPLRSQLAQAPLGKIVGPVKNGELMYYFRVLEREYLKLPSRQELAERIARAHASGPSPWGPPYQVEELE